jgi:DNA-binding response OmpR family regulator
MRAMVACDCRGEEIARIMRGQDWSVAVAGLGWPLIDQAAAVDLVIVCLGPCAMARATRGGLDLAAEIAERHEIALMSMAHSDNDDERVRALSAGCDDHIVMPLHAIELMARVDAVMRRVTGLPKGDRIEWGPLCIDLRIREVCLHQQVVALTRKEFDLLWLLAQADSAVSRAEIATRIWGGDVVASSRTIDTHVNSLRRKLGRSTVVTVRGFGFRFGEPPGGAGIRIALD